MLILQLDRIDSAGCANDEMAKYELVRRCRCIVFACVHTLAEFGGIGEFGGGEKRFAQKPFVIYNAFTIAHHV